MNNEKRQEVKLPELENMPNLERAYGRFTAASLDAYDRARIECRERQLLEALQKIATLERKVENFHLTFSACEREANNKEARICELEQQLDKAEGRIGLLRVEKQELEQQAFVAAANYADNLAASEARWQKAEEAARVEGFNEAKELAAQKCDIFVEAYSFCTPYPEGYIYSSEESRAFMIGAGSRFEVAAANIRGLVFDSERQESAAEGDRE